MFIEQLIPHHEIASSFNFKFKKMRFNNLLRSPKLASKSKGKLEVSQSVVCTAQQPSREQHSKVEQHSKEQHSKVDVESTVKIRIAAVVPGGNIADEDMPLAKGLKSHSTENLSKHHISNINRQHRNSLIKDSDDNPICNLPLPLSLALGISSLSDSKLYSYHNSQDFLTFLTKGARDVEEAERNNTIDTALNIIKELKNLVEENTKLLNFVHNTQEYNPSSEIDDVMVGNITKTLAEHRYTVCKMCERAKGYKTQLILAESDLDTNNSQDMKTDLLAMRKSLSWMSMIVRYHMWGSNVAEESLYHSDDDVVNQRRKLGRRNCIRVRERPKWSEETSGASSPTTNRQLSSSSSVSSKTNTQNKVTIKLRNTKR